MYKNSVKFICRRCGYPQMATIGSNCEISGKCSPCIEGRRKHRMDWSAWQRGQVKHQPPAPAADPIGPIRKKRWWKFWVK